MQKQKILVIDDEPGSGEAFRIILKDDYEVVCAHNGKDGLKIIQEDHIQLVLLDIIMPEMDGLAVLHKIREIDQNLTVVMVTATKSIKSAVEAMKLGAFDYISKPFEVNEAKLVVNKAMQNRVLLQELEYLRAELLNKYGIENIVGKSKAVTSIFQIIKKVAPTKSTVLITGESGTGKELVARAIHYSGPRGNKPFIVMQCAAIPETLMESELFGHEKGAFTDASCRKMGKLESAHLGTLFLDEIGEMIPSIQAKVLRALEQQEFTRVGGEKPVNIDVRLIAATNRDLKKAVKEGAFREDLYYRLNVVPIELSPLRERKEDIPLLVKFFLEKYKKEICTKAEKFSPEVINILTDYSWPGNIRELENMVERILTLTNHSIIQPEDLPSYISAKTEQLSGAACSFTGEEITLPAAVNKLEKTMIIQALDKTDWVLSQAARQLGLTQRILKYKMDNLGIQGKKVLVPE
ncbi:MAG: sigma-54 dependent transcriptional regulator [Candidatus Omnitrophota bacterium]